jgi:hypothetical protein
VQTHHFFRNKKFKNKKERKWIWTQLECIDIIDLGDYCFGKFREKKTTDLI